MGALRASCRALRFQTAWREACAPADPIGPENTEALRRYLETNFIPHRVANPDGATQGLITGYYEPLLRGSRESAAPTVSPFMHHPTICLSSTSPQSTPT
jgi:membrane-bound lytic murein transglycosylase A